MRLNVTALSYATIAVMWVVVGLTIWAEQSESFKALLASLGGHHWVGKSIVSLVAFVVLYILLQRVRELRGALIPLLAVCASVIVGGIIIFLFFVSHYLGG